MPQGFSPNAAALRSVAPILLLGAFMGSCKTVGGHGSGLDALGQSDASAPTMTELDSSVIVVGNGDWLSDRCVKMVDNAAQYQQSRIMFVPTLFWVQTGDGPVDYYCYERQYDNDGNVSCPAADADKIIAFQNAMQRCFKRAIDAKFSIALTPHLDDGTGQGRWRNILNFDPIEKQRGFSYADVAIFPLTDALNAVATPDTKIYFSMQGEMSATVFRHPESWRALIPQIKERLLAGRDEAFRQNIQVGVSTNFNKLAGCVGLDIIDPAEYVRRYPVLWDAVKDQFNLPAIQALYGEVDYFGISSYPSLAPHFPPSQVEGAMEQFDFELAFFGLTVNSLIQKGKHLHLSEYGVGGGVSQNGNVKAIDAAGAAATPFFGIFNTYSTQTDPWMLYDLSKPSPVRDYERYFYDRTLDYLSHRKQYKYQVDAAFIWNQSSWDVQGIYPESSSADGSYRDPATVEKINTHNAAAMAGLMLSSCTDLDPPGDYTCADQLHWNQCDASFMAEYCDKTCGRCK